MLLRQMIYFQAVVAEGSFTKAAESQHISQSAISQQIQALETELDVTLLNRRNRGFEVTDAGRYFYKKSLALIANLDEICQETQKIAHDEVAQLSIGYLSSYEGGEIQEAIARFASQFPDVKLTIRTGTHEDLYQDLMAERIDIAVNDQRRAFSTNYNNLVLTEKETYVELATFNPLSKRDEVNLEDLADIPCILVASPEQQENEEAYYRDIIGFKGDFLFASSLQEARMLVVGNRGVMPIEVGKGETYFGSTLKRLPLLRDGKQLTRRYCAFWAQDNSGYYVEEMSELLLEAFGGKNASQAEN